ncbi:MAG: hypothetical protein KBD39_12590, partial [Sterolibacterium sp.]|nr:hypothetical protein [Sterolibacterium sp.]
KQTPPTIFFARSSSAWAQTEPAIPSKATTARDFIVFILKFNVLTVDCFKKKAAGITTGGTP